MSNPTPAEVLTQYQVNVRAPAGPEHRHIQQAERVVAEVITDGMIKALTDAGYSIVFTEVWDELNGQVLAHQMSDDYSKGHEFGTLSGIAMERERILNIVAGVSIDPDCVMGADEIAERIEADDE